MNGIDGDGQLTVVLSALLGVLGIVIYKSNDKRVSTAGRLTGIALAAAVGVIGIYDINEISSEPDDSFIQISVGFGLYLTVLAGILGIVGAVGLKKRVESVGPD